MDSKELIHPENENIISQEVNSGVSEETQRHATEELPANVENDVVLSSGVTETAEEIATEEPSETVVEAIVDTATTEQPSETAVEATVDTATTEQPSETVVEATVDTATTEQPSETVVEATVDTAITEQPSETVVEATVDTVITEQPSEITSEVAGEIKEDPVVTNAETMMEDIESAQHDLVHGEEDTDDTSKNEDDIEKITAEYEALSAEEAVAVLSEVVADTDYNKIKHRVGILKSKLLNVLKSHRQEQLAAFLQSGGNKEEFEASPVAWEDRFNAAMQLFKDNKNRFMEALEAEKQRNLEAKKDIIEGLKKLVETENNLKVLNDNFKEFQEQWKSIGAVPQNESANLWQNYHFYVEKFFDILRINKELRTLDLKKNLEQKIKLCEKAESLLLLESVSDSFKALQELHNEWKEIGPVPEDKKEEIWERFKTASDQINIRRKEFYDRIFAEQQNNYNAKVVLCEQAEELVSAESQSIRDYKEISDKLTELLKMWKTLGPAPVKLNEGIWQRFRETLDKFFQEKKDYFQGVKDEQMQNYNRKLDIAIRAEAVSIRTDWKDATTELLQLQKEWKEIGAVPHKYSQIVWKRFRTACDKFFEAKSHYFSDARQQETENLEKKENLIERIKTHIFGTNKAENLEVLKAFQREWTEIGFVPKKVKEKLYNSYREAINKCFNELKLNPEDLRHDRFKSKIETILSNPNAGKILDKEKRFLTSKVEKLKEDIRLWENNLGFFVHSKNADLLKSEFLKKIEAAKAEMKDLEYRIRVMKNPPKSDKDKKEDPVSETEIADKAKESIPDVEDNAATIPDENTNNLLPEESNS
ncbi:MAG: DUF349 domain-containing protein [Bacteroidales bacterium]|jgi:hypothetical protein|nr:DUF349 domain-containing protein [Bacteroidales bacterium]